MESGQNLFKSLGEWIANVAKALWARLDAYIKANPRRAAIIGGSIVLLLLSLLIRAPQPHVSLKAEPILAGGPAWFTNALLTTFVVDIILILLDVSIDISSRLELITKSMMGSGVDV